MSEATIVTTMSGSVCRSTLWGLGHGVDGDVTPNPKPRRPRGWTQSGRRFHLRSDDQFHVVYPRPLRPMMMPDTYG
jgi:hypothetical protein